MVRARDLLNVDSFGASDPFVRVLFREKKQKTKVIENELNPEWNETLTYELDGKALSSDETIEVSVLDHEKIGKSRELGTSRSFLTPKLSYCHVFPYSISCFH